MDEKQSEMQRQSAETTATMRGRQAGSGQPAGQWKAIIRDLVHEAPLLAFMIGVVVARR